VTSILFSCLTAGDIKAFGLKKRQAQTQSLKLDMPSHSVEKLNKVQVLESK
jgi:hypothetical protein